MKKFKAIAVMRTYLEIEIEAEDEDQAWKLANEADGADFDPVHFDTIANDGDWEIIRVTPTPN